MTDLRASNDSACYLAGMNEPQIITLRPFRRPSIITAEETRDALVARAADIRSNYAVKIDPDELRGVGCEHSSTKPGAPKPGDLHDWDKLVDGCLYIDRECSDDKPYYYRLNGLGDWISVAGEHDHYPQPVAAGQETKQAEVLIASLTDLEEMRLAARTHAVCKMGGAK